MNARGSYIGRPKPNPNSNANNANNNNNLGTVERPTIAPQSITKQQADKNLAQDMIIKIM